MVNTTLMILWHNNWARAKFTELFSFLFSYRLRHSNLFLLWLFLLSLSLLFSLHPQFNPTIIYKAWCLWWRRQYSFFNPILLAFLSSAFSESQTRTSWWFYRVLTLKYGRTSISFIEFKGFLASFGVNTTCFLFTLIKNNWLLYDPIVFVLVSFKPSNCQIWFGSYLYIAYLGSTSRLSSCLFSEVINASSHFLLEIPSGILLRAEHIQTLTFNYI
jgi:hypothetical protein